MTFQLLCQTLYNYYYFRELLTFILKKMAGLLDLLNSDLGKTLIREQVNNLDKTKEKQQMH